MRRLRHSITALFLAMGLCGAARRRRIWPPSSRRSRSSRSWGPVGRSSSEPLRPWRPIRATTRPSRSFPSWCPRRGAQQSGSVPGTGAAAAARRSYDADDRRPGVQGHRARSGPRQRALRGGPEGGPRQLLRPLSARGDPGSLGRKGVSAGDCPLPRGGREDSAAICRLARRDSARDGRRALQPARGQSAIWRRGAGRVGRHDRRLAEIRLADLRGSRRPVPVATALAKRARDARALLRRAPRDQRRARQRHTLPAQDAHRRNLRAAGAVRPGRRGARARRPRCWTRTLRSAGRWRTAFASAA